MRTIALDTDRVEILKVWKAKQNQQCLRLLKGMQNLLK